MDELQINVWFVGRIHVEEAGIYGKEMMIRWGAFRWRWQVSKVKKLRQGGVHPGGGGRYLR